MTEAEWKEHDAIVEQLRRAGWGRWEALEEADRLMFERTERRRAVARMRKAEVTKDMCDTPKE